MQQVEATLILVKLCASLHSTNFNPLAVWIVVGWNICFNHPKLLHWLTIALPLCEARSVRMPSKGNNSLMCGVEMLTTQHILEENGKM